MLETLIYMKSPEIHPESEKSTENQRNSFEFNEIQWNSTEFDGIRCARLSDPTNPCKIDDTDSKTMEFNASEYQII